MLVVGAARSGIAAAEALARRGAIVTLTDIRDTIEAADRLRAAGVTVELGGHRAETIAAADLIVVSPGVPLDQPIFESAQKRGTEIIGELELAWRWTRGRVIAITSRDEPSLAGMNPLAMAKHVHQVRGDTRSGHHPERVQGARLELEAGILLTLVERRRAGEVRE